LLIAAGIALALSMAVDEARAEKVYFAGYKGGFYIRSEEEGGMELRLGGTFQADYRYYAEEERADNRFDLRRSRLMFRGGLTQWFRFGMEFEFQGNETSNIVESYGELVRGPHALKLGQFKEPFSLEWQTRDKALFFAERSMAYSLGPKRDIGLMAHGSAWYDALNYSLGVFNGDGEDGSTRGNEHDEPEIAGRIVIAPFKSSALDAVRNLQVGASATYARIDLANIDLKVKSTGMYGSNRNLYVLSNNTKFGVVQDVDDRQRFGIEAAWALGPFLLQAEGLYLKYSRLKPSGGPAMDAEFAAAYASISYCLTGENQRLYGGVVKPVYPKNFFDPDIGTWGALCLSARLEHFEGDEDWINPASYVSTQKADAYSLAANWTLFPMVRIIFDYTHTDFSDPLRVRVLPNGEIDYIDEENVFTCRFSMDF
jgi:phosphate-selective porin OprO/OprP